MQVAQGMIAKGSDAEAKSLLYLRILSILKQLYCSCSSALPSIPLLLLFFLLIRQKQQSFLRVSDVQRRDLRPREEQECYRF